MPLSLSQFSSALVDTKTENKHQKLQSLPYICLLSVVLIADSRVLEKMEVANFVKTSEAIKATVVVSHPRPSKEVSNLYESKRLSPTGPDPQHH